MIDRVARDKTVAAIEAYMNDEMMAFEFDDTLQDIVAKTEDEAVVDAVRILWYFYDDLTDHNIHASKEQWNLMYRMILFLRSDAELEIKKNRLWSATQIVAFGLMVLIALLAWTFSESWILLIAWIGAGILTWEMSRRIRTPLYYQYTIHLTENTVFPFDSSLDILRAARSVPNFHKRPFPSELAKRRIRNGLLGAFLETEIHFPRLIILPLAFVGWTIVLPLVLIGQLFPLHIHRRTVVVPTVSHQ